MRSNLNVFRGFSMSFFISSAVAQAESLRYKLLGGLAVRRACYGVLRFIMESGAKGAEVIVAGKLSGARAKASKFNDGYMVKSAYECFVAPGDGNDELFS